MKSTADLVGGWIRKGDSDLATVELCVTSATALDAACFHAQQAVEKYLKAYMIAGGISFPLTHNLEKLIELCIPGDNQFSQIKDAATQLTPYSVVLRYDDEFWPSQEEAEQALTIARDIRMFIVKRLPAEMNPET